MPTSIPQLIKNSSKGTNKIPTMMPGLCRTKLGGPSRRKHPERSATACVSIHDDQPHAGTIAGNAKEHKCTIICKNRMYAIDWYFLQIHKYIVKLYTDINNIVKNNQKHMHYNYVHVSS